MTTGESSSPWGEVSQLSDILVAWADLPSGNGAWDPDYRVILLDRRLTRRQARCTLAHELEHARCGDVAVDDVSSVLATRQEIAAHTNAARRLIPLDALIRALQWSQDEREVADDLNVTEEMVRQRLLTLSQGEHAEIDRRLWQFERECGESA